MTRYNKRFLNAVRMNNFDRMSLCITKGANIQSVSRIGSNGLMVSGNQ